MTTIPATFRAALAGIQNADFVKSVRYRDQQWRAERREVDPQLLTFERILVRRMGKLNVPMFTNEGMRTATRQAELFDAGFSRLRRQGPHMVGMAVDIIHGVKGWELAEDHAANRKAWDLIGHVGKEIIQQEGFSITWGGDWRSPWDPAHWERTNWSSLPFPAPF